MKVRNAPLAVIVALALPAAWAAAETGAAAQAGAAYEPAAAARPDTAARRGTRPPAGNRLDERVALLTKELDLDPGQQTQVRRILQAQRDQVQQAWNDPARSSADRIGVTQAISEQTADQIRALLREEQRKKYLAPKPTRAAGDHPEHGLDYWMDRMQGTH
jgi:Spy/CpxP family protein refolding chaperone